MPNKKLIMFDFDGVLVNTTLPFSRTERDVYIPAELKNLIAKLASEYTLVIVSSSGTKSIKKVLATEGIESCFSGIFGGDIEGSKASKIQQLLQDESTDSGDAVFITDTNKDVSEATACGVQSIAVTWGLQTKDMFAESHPLASADTAAELEKAIQNFQKGL